MPACLPLLFPIQRHLTRVCARLIPPRCPRLPLCALAFACSQQVCDFVSPRLAQGQAPTDIASELLNACLASDPREARGIGCDNMTAAVGGGGGMQQGICVCASGGGRGGNDGAAGCCSSISG